MRIAYALHQFFPRHITGTETYTLGLAKASLKHGHDVAVLCGEHSARGEVPSYGVIDDEYESIPVRRLCHHAKLSPNYTFYEYYNPFMGELSRRFFQEYKPDVVHFTHCALLTGAAVEAAQAADIPTVLTLTDFWFICPRIQLLRENEEMCEGPREPAQCLQCCWHEFPDLYYKYRQSSQGGHNLFFDPPFLIKALLAFNRAPLYGGLVAALNRKSFLQSIVEKVDAVIAPSQFLKDMYESYDMGKEKLMHLPFGIDLSAINDIVKVPSSTLRIGFIGTLTSHKGCHILLQAVQGLTEENIQINIYGSMEQFPEYTAGLTNLVEDDTRISFRGTFPQEKLAAVFADIDVLVVPSLWHENTPLTVYSALATKTPVIASRLEGLKEVIKHDVNGLFFEKGNVAELSEILKRIVGKPELLESLRSGIQPVKSMEEHAIEMLDMYEKLLVVGEETVG